MDLLGRRWALRVLWELRDEPLGLRPLRSRCDGMSSSVLYTRLRELTDAGLVEQRPDGAYQLTDLGIDLGSALQPLELWAARWEHLHPARPGNDAADIPVGATIEGLPAERETARREAP
jgi:DNA-binding HxlR family transcriptional regulator